MFLLSYEIDRKKIVKANDLSSKKNIYLVLREQHLFSQGSIFETGFSTPTPPGHRSRTERDLGQSLGTRWGLASSIAYDERKDTPPKKGEKTCG